MLKVALNPNFLNLTINREKFWLQKRFGPISYLAFVKQLYEDFTYDPFQSPFRKRSHRSVSKINVYSSISDKIN